MLNYCLNLKSIPMKKATYFLALFVFFNLITLTSCTPDDIVEDESLYTTQETLATGGEYGVPPPPDRD
jgi:hypothetical protein